MVSEPIRDIKKIQEFKEALEMGQNGFRNRLLFELSLATALRITDTLNLKKKDIKDGFVRVRTRKTGAYKMIELNPKVYRMVLVHIENKKDDDFLFEIGRVQAWKIIKKAADLVGIANISTHSMRKTSAWHFYKNTNHDLQKTAHLLGHKDPKETRVYLQITEDEVNAQLRSQYL